ncbi:hypothetical protein [Amycolatopsis sp. CA-230715]|uniref:hypothetical protein n=1 Tax=Amycolatopsis sp. CA-230715 TaxID=2745196 RepID=UPI001C02F87D|nr:hypothetical protein [Amycolatopsis sp. CA-230715]QWF79001.1 hypothetical protein HUW46_02402 [Amycolatopsis sp. CA-230715]
MKPDLDTRGEILKLARVLGVPPSRLDYLAPVPVRDLRLLRARVTDVLFDANLPTLRRMAAASKLIPAPVVAKIAERTFGPLLCARIAGLVDPARGVDVAKRLSTRFLADVATELDPRRASEIIAGIPTPIVVSVAGELVGRADWITIGRFVGHLHEGAISACLEVIDDAALLEVAFVLDDKARIDHVVRLLPSPRFSGVVVAAADSGSWESVLDLISHVSLGRREKFVAALRELPADTRASAEAAASELGVDLS